MTDAIALLWLPLLASIMLVGIHTYFGMQVLARGVIFVDLALAQLAALGGTVAFMLGHPAQSTGTLAWSLGFTLLAALLLASTRRLSSRIPQEALIGVIYVVAAAASFLLVDKAPQGTEHIKQILTGNILTVGGGDLFTIAPLYAAIAFLHWLARERLARSASGTSSWLWDFFFFGSFGVVVTSSVALAGVLLVFSFLIIPAAIGLLYADRPVIQLVIGWIAGAAASLAGLAASYAWDLPTGATMVCTFGLALACAGILRPLRRRSMASLKTAAGVLRGVVALCLAASALWLTLAPRSDQPLLDSFESLAPELRAAYMSASERAVYDEADVYADRHRLQIERLNTIEANSRWQGRALDDFEVRRISSFLQSYGEMRKGEEFVKREVRSRARERSRWWLGATLVLLALLTYPEAAVRARRTLRVRRQL